MPPEHPTWLERYGDGKGIYPLLTTGAFCLPFDPGDNAVYMRLVLASKPVHNTPLTRTKQACIDLLFTHQKCYPSCTLSIIGIYCDDELIIFHGHHANDWLHNWLQFFQCEVDQLLGKFDIQYYAP
jgi:hypothetical protein